MSFKAIIILCIGFAAGLLLFKKIENRHHDSRITIGILQTASHPALDQVREGFMQEMQRNAQQPLHFVVQNAEGSLTQAQSIASNFHSHRKIKAILAIGTPAVQAIARVEKEKPIFISAVSAPESLGILESNTNLCGTTDRTDTRAQAELTVDLIPHVDTITILYSLGEANSQIMVHKMKASLEEQGFHPTLLGIHTESEIAAAVHSIARKSQALITPADNLVATAMPLLVKETLKHKLPFIVSDPLCVFQGALAAVGADYHTLGEQTAVLAQRVLFQQESPEGVGIHNPAGLKTVINQKALTLLELSAAEHLLSRSELVQGGCHAQ